MRHHECNLGCDRYGFHVERSAAPAPYGDIIWVVRAFEAEEIPGGEAVAGTDGKVGNEFLGITG